MPAFGRTVNQASERCSHLLSLPAEWACRDRHRQTPGATWKRARICPEAPRDITSFTFCHMDLAQSVCVVTGGSEGIGRATALALARRGARVAICGRSADRVTEVLHEIVKEQPDGVGAVCDVRSETSINQFQRRVKERLGTVDVIVNNAGLGYFALLGELTGAQINEMLDVNVKGMLLVTRAFLPAMLERRSGHIVNVSSLAGRNGFVGGTAYTATKHAVLGFSKSLMLEVRDFGIRVTAICPGSVDTSFFAKAGTTVNNAERLLKPEDVADTIVAALQLPDHAMVSELDIRPTTP
jgi:3-oxoacyl-[acyl-carrier protein] reductase